MTARKALEELRDFFEDEPELEAATVARGKGDSAIPEVRVLNLAQDAEGFFRGVVRSAVVDKVGRWSLKKLDPLYKPDPDELEWERTADVEAVELAVDRYKNLSPLAQFDPGDDDYKKRLLYWVLVLTHTDGRQAFFFRSFTASAELKRKRGAALVARQGTFQRVEERIFLFEDTIDCFVFDDYLYVLRKRDYRRIFDQLDQIRRRAKRAARALHRKVPIANIDEFAEACSTDSRMADKVLAVQKRDYFSTLSYDRLKKVIKEFSLEIPTKKRNGKVYLVFRTEPNQRFRILKLVDDDYLRSSWTDHRYEVNSKTDPPG